ncbi:methyltransferase domain-containing protein [Streptomyces sp. NPDC005953]|uniref:SAM-dependent methyltransferase n=1 Tax=Streptomyces sp. NPDC005953 TaxID=3156719 RepID=UPI0033CA9EA8
MTHPHHSAPTDVGTMYDQFSDVFSQAMGGNIHVGYWDSADDPTTVEQATDRVTDMVADRLAAQPGQHLLDIGCGTGRPATRIATRTQARITGITISPHQLERAQQTAQPAGDGGHVDFRFADVMKLPFGDTTFDAAYAIESLFHVPDRTVALTEASRTVRPGGHLVVTDLLLRRPVTGAAKASMDAAAGILQVANFTSPDDYRAQLAAAEWQLVEFDDIGEQVRRTYTHLIATLRGLRDSVPAELAGLVDQAVDAIGEFATCPEVGYALITARRA